VRKEINEQRKKIGDHLIIDLNMAGHHLTMSEKMKLVFDITCMHLHAGEEVFSSKQAYDAVQYIMNM